MCVKRTTGKSILPGTNYLWYVLQKAQRRATGGGCERGYGELTALHQLGHAGKRKNRSEFDVHERYNDIVDGPTHETNDLMPVYAPFARERLDARLCVVRA